MGPVIPAQEKLVGEPPKGGVVRLVKASDGATLRIAVWPGDRGAVILLHGRTEYIEKYYPVIFELQRRGFAVATLDWRGQGLSERLVGHPLKGHVDDFDEYQRDVDALLDAREVRALRGPKILMSNSMGGCVATRLLHRKPDLFMGAIFSCPMFGLLLSTGINYVANIATKLVTSVGLDHEYAAGQPMEPYTDMPFIGNALTTDFDEFNRQRDLIAEERGLAVAGVTWSWMRAALSEMTELERIEPSPIRSLYWVGSEEAVISVPAVAARVAASPNARFAMIAGARHDPLFERPEVRARAWREVDAFLDKLGLGPDDR